MHKYFIKTPWLAKMLFRSYVWNLPPDDHAVYLTFDDGPHPEITPWVLDELRAYSARATFFCIGDNVRKYPDTYRKIVEEGHATGNHTYHHLNGWKTPDRRYLEDIARAGQLIESNLFRPPYGRIKNRQAKKLVDSAQMNKPKIIMWDVLSADFDPSLKEEQCLANVIDHVEAGSVIVFHDSEKAFRNLRYTLPRTLRYLAEKGFRMNRIEL